MNDLHDCLIKQFQERRNINDTFKERNQVKWVQEMNNINNAIDELIINESICIKSIKLAYLRVLWIHS